MVTLYGPTNMGHLASLEGLFRDSFHRQFPWPFFWVPIIVSKGRLSFCYFHTYITNSVMIGRECIGILDCF